RRAARRAFTGVVVARTQSDLGFRVAGKVLERRVTVERAEGRSPGLYRRGSGPNPKRPRLQGGGKSA
ncbi:hypothetical protein EXD72_27635, partial [Klebsiella pneumoniae]